MSRAVVKKAVKSPRTRAPRRGISTARTSVAQPLSVPGRIIDRAERGERVILKRGKKSVAALISMEDLKLFERPVEEEEDRQDIQAADKAMAEAEKVGTIPWEKVKADLGL